MLNRHSLRIKGMQALFSYHTAREAARYICKAKAADQYLTHEDMPIEKDAWSERRTYVEETFDLYRLQGAAGIAADTPPEMIAAVKQADLDFQNQLQENKSHFKRHMMGNVSSIYHNYIKLILLIIEIPSAAARKNRRTNDHTPSRWEKNRVIHRLKNFETLNEESRKNHVAWDPELIQGWFRKYIREETFFKRYDNLAESSLRDDLEVVLSIYKSVVFKNKDIHEYFENLDIEWMENKPILKSMVLKTLKSIQPEEGSDVLWIRLLEDREDDLRFLERLYELSIDCEAVYEKLIKAKAKNWNVTRLALIDKILLEMAMAEMIHFPSIPTKVTINEYIELSKLYSTPKSKQFVNGLLDVLLTELQQKGQIKKSGRGLLDNK